MEETKNPLENMEMEAETAEDAVAEAETTEAVKEENKEENKDENKDENSEADEMNAEDVVATAEATFEDKVQDPVDGTADADEAENEIKETTQEKEEKEDKEEKEEKVSRGDKKKLKKVEAELNEVKKALLEKDGALADLNDKYMRLCAEYDNFRKRSAKEREGIYTDACSDVLMQILPILDNLERAAQYNTEDTAEGPLGKGLELTLKSFYETLEKLGVAEIEAEGKCFDPNVHNAVMHIDDENYGENQIVEVFMKGYAKGDKVLRYSMVKVAN